jgi:hypothetical protein
MLELVQTHLIILQYCFSVIFNVTKSGLLIPRGLLTTLFITIQQTGLIIFVTVIIILLYRAGNAASHKWIALVSAVANIPFEKLHLEQILQQLTGGMVQLCFHRVRDIFKQIDLWNAVNNDAVDLTTMKYMVFFQFKRRGFHLSTILLMGRFLLMVFYTNYSLNTLTAGTGINISNVAELFNFDCLNVLTIMLCKCAIGGEWEFIWDIMTMLNNSRGKYILSNILAPSYS